MASVDKHRGFYTKVKYDWATATLPKETFRSLMVALKGDLKLQVELEAIEKLSGSLQECMNQKGYRRDLTKAERDHRTYIKGTKENEIYMNSSLNPGEGRGSGISTGDIICKENGGPNCATEKEPPSHKKECSQAAHNGAEHKFSGSISIPSGSDHGRLTFNLPPNSHNNNSVPSDTPYGLYKTSSFGGPEYTNTVSAPEESLSRLFGGASDRTPSYSVNDHLNSFDFGGPKYTNTVSAPEESLSRLFGGASDRTPSYSVNDHLNSFDFGGPKYTNTASAPEDPLPRLFGGASDRTPSYSVNDHLNSFDFGGPKYTNTASAPEDPLPRLLLNSGLNDRASNCDLLGGPNGCAQPVSTELHDLSGMVTSRGGELAKKALQLIDKRAEEREKVAEERAKAAEKKADVAEERAKAAEERAEAAEEREKAAEKRAKAAEDKLRTLQDTLRGIEGLLMGARAERAPVA